MWKATALMRDGTRREVAIRELGTEGPFSGVAALTEAERFAVRPHLLELMRQEAKDPRLLFSAIETWSEEAEREANQFDWSGAPRLRRAEEALAWYASDGTSKAKRGPAWRHPVSLAWHDRSGVVMFLSGEEESVSVEYEPTREDEHRARRLAYRYATPKHRVEYVLDWRGYFGSQTGVVDGWLKMRRQGRGLVGTFKGVAGIVVGTVLRRATLPEWSPQSDPRMSTRLREMELRYGGIADACPSLDDIGLVDHEHAIVFVHGTASCGIAGLKDLFSRTVDDWPLPGPVYRFEHDTFQPIKDNAKALANQIAGLIRCRNLLLVAHSRGGLVAVEAAHYLAKDHYPGDVRVQTFGTPFRGTPLVAIGQRVVNVFMKLGEDIATAIPCPLMSALAKGIFYLVETPKLPAGIAAMHLDAPDRAYRDELIDESRLTAWGSDFDIERGSPGFGVSVEGILLGALGKERHDLVVPMASAMAFSGRVPVLGCSHVHYFRDQQVRSAIEAFFPPPLIPVVPVATPSAGDGEPPSDPGIPGRAIKRKAEEFKARNKV
jgi:hypothetical protein